MSYKSSLLLALALSVAGISPAFAQQKPIPIESFVKQDQFSEPRLSPDGKHIAIKVLVPRNGRMVPTLTVYSLPELKLVATLALKGKSVPVNFSWVNNTRLVMNRGIESNFGERPARTGDVLAVDLDGKRYQSLYGPANDVESTKGDRYGADEGFGMVQSIPDVRNDHVLVGAYIYGGNRSFLYDIDSVQATRKLVAEIPAPGLDFYAQRDGIPLLATSRDDDFLPVVYRRNDAGKWQKLEKEAAGTTFEVLETSLDDTEFFVFVSSKDEPAALIRESLKTGKRTVLAQDARSDLSVEWDVKRAVPFAVTTRIGIPAVRYLEGNSPSIQLHKTLAKQFPGSVVHFINFADDGSKLLFEVSSDRDPGSFYLYDKNAGTADLLFSASEDIDPAQMAERRPFAFKARDGIEIFGYLTLPPVSKNPDGTKQKLPMVLMPHDGPFGFANVWSFDQDAQFLASRGYAVLQINFRGSLNRGGEFEKSGFKQWGGKIQDDLIDGVKAAIQEGEVDSKRICTYGKGFGGYSALLLPAREPGMFKCAVGLSGFYDLPYIYKQDNVVASSYRKKYYMRTLGNDDAELALQSPARMADKIKVPVWLVHGDQDEVAPVEHAKRMRDALIKVGRAPEWTLEEDLGHDLFSPKRRIAFYENLEKFLGKYLGKPDQK